MRGERPARASSTDSRPASGSSASARRERDTVPPDLIEVDREYREKVEAVAAPQGAADPGRARAAQGRGRARRPQGEAQEVPGAAAQRPVEPRVLGRLERDRRRREVDPLDRGPVPRARGRDRDGARGPRGAREEPARRDRAARGAAQGLARRAARDQRRARRRPRARSRSSRRRSRRATAPSSGGCRQEARPRGRARRRRLLLGLPRQGPPGRHADPQAGPRDHLLRQLQADPLLRAAELVDALVRFRAFIDGAARGNPGPAGRGRLRLGRGGSAGRGALRGARAHDQQRRGVPRAPARPEARRRSARPRTSSIASDSLLLVQQMLGRYRVKAPHLQPLFAEALRRAKAFRRFAIAPRPARGQQEGRPPRQSRRRRERARTWPESSFHREP